MNHLNDNELVLALDGEMEEADLKQAVDHLAECDECRHKWEKLQGLSERVVEYSASLYSPSHVATKPLVADERRLTLIEKTRIFELPVWKWGLVAAVVLVGVSVALWNASRLSDAHSIAQGQLPRDKDGAQAQKPEALRVNSAKPSLGLHALKVVGSGVRKLRRKL